MVTREKRIRLEAANKRGSKSRKRDECMCLCLPDQMMMMVFQYRNLTKMILFWVGNGKGDDEKIISHMFDLMRNGWRRLGNCVECSR